MASDDATTFNKSIFWFTTRERAEEELEKFVDEYRKFDSLTLAEYKELVGLKTHFSDSQIGWRELDLSKVFVRRTLTGYEITLPVPTDSGKVYPEVEDFLDARLTEEERIAIRFSQTTEQELRRLKELTAMREIVRYHEKWPVMVTGEAKVEPSGWEMHRSPMDLMRIQMTQQIDFLTQKHYVERFGEQPPTAPILKMLARIWSSHVDYNPDWSK